MVFSSIAKNIKMNLCILDMYSDDNMIFYKYLQYYHLTPLLYYESAFCIAQLEKVQGKE